MRAQVFVQLICLGLVWPATEAAAQAPRSTRAIADAILEARAPSRDDADELAARLLTAAIEHASSPATELLVDAVRRRIGDLQQPEKTVANLRKLLAARPHGTAERAARSAIAILLANRSQYGAAIAVGAYDDYASALLAIGPFGDSGDYHTGAVYPPELRFPHPGEKLAGRFGDVESRLAQRRPLRSTISLKARGDQHDGCFYGLHQVDVDADAFGYVEVTCTSSFELFVNGRRTAVRNRHVERVGSRLWAPVLLPKGRNHVIVKTTLNKRSDVALCYVDAAGRPLPGARETADQTDVRPHVAAATPRDATPFIDGLRALIGAAAANEGEAGVVLSLAAALTAFDRGEVQIGLEQLGRLEGDRPTEGQPAIAFAQALLGAQLLPAEFRQGRARNIVERLRETMPDHHTVVSLTARFARDDDKLEDAVRMLQARADAGEAGPQTFAQLYAALRQLRFDARARRTLAAWHEALPEDSRPVVEEATLRNAGGDARGALKILRQAAARTGDASVHRRILPLARQLGDADLALATTAKIHARDPDALGALVDRADTLRLLGRTDAAVAVYREIAGHADASARQLKAAGDWLRRAGQADAARAALRRSLERDPAQHALRRELGRQLETAPTAAPKDYAHFAPFRRDAEALIEAFEVSAREETATSTLLLDQMIVEVLEDGSMVEETHQVRRINDLQGVEQFQEARDAARATELLAVRTIAKDGTEFVPHRVAGSFSLPRLEPGAFVETRYRNFDASPRPGPRRATKFFFQGDAEPFVLSELVVILPANAPGAFRLRNFAGERSERPLDGGRIAHVFTARDVPRLPSERNHPPLEEIVPLVTWGEDQAPDANARETFTRAVYGTYSSPLVAAKTQELVGDVRGDTARMRAIHAWAHAEIPNTAGTPDPTSILLTKKGPRFYLIAAMLREAGVPLRFAACAAQREELSDSPTPLFLGEEIYGVMAVRVEPRDGAVAWLFRDAPRHWPLGKIPAPRQGAAAILLDEGDHRLIRLPGGDDATDEGLDVRAAVTLDAESGRATMNGTITVRGWVGYLLADRIRNLKENIQTIAARQFVGQILEDWRANDIDLSATKQPGQPMQARGTLIKRGALEKVGDQWRMELPMSRTDFLRRFGDRGERQLPLRLSELYSDSWEVTVDPGADLQLLDVPPPVRVRKMLLDYHLSFTRAGDKLRIRRDVLLRPGTILPAQVDEWLRLLRRLDLAEELQIKLGAT